MVDEDAAQAAMRELNGASIDGQPIKVGIDPDMMDPKSCDCILVLIFDKFHPEG